MGCCEGRKVGAQEVDMIGCIVCNDGPPPPEALSEPSLELSLIHWLVHVWGGV